MYATISMAMPSRSIHSGDEIPAPHDTRYLPTRRLLGGVRHSWEIKTRSIWSAHPQCDIPVVTSSYTNTVGWSPLKTHVARTSTEMFTITCWHGLITAKSRCVVARYVNGHVDVIAGN